MGLLATLCHPWCRPTTVQGCDDPAQAVLGQTSEDFSFPGYPALNHGAHRGAEESVKPQQIPTVSACCQATAPAPRGELGVRVSRGVLPSWLAPRQGAQARPMPCLSSGQRLPWPFICQKQGV